MPQRPALRAQTDGPQDGPLVPSFGDGGRVTTDVGGNTQQQPTSVARQSDGRIIVVGSAIVAPGADHDFVMLRYEQDGQLDTGFGENGLSVTDVSGGGPDYAHAVLVLPDDRIIVVGSALMPMTQTLDFVVARYDANGTLDPDFAQGGIQTTDFRVDDEEAFGVAEQDDGRLVVVGRAGSGDEADFAIARYTETGVHDTDFFGFGYRTHDVTGGFDAARAVLLPRSSGIVVVGTGNFQDAAGVSDFELVRFHSDGVVDETFNNGTGRVLTDFNGGIDVAHAAKLDASARIIVAGTTVLNDQRDFAVARYNRDGTPDTTFHGNGHVSTDFFGGNDQAHAIDVQQDGSLIVAGFAVRPGRAEDFALAKYTDAGVLDASLDDDGLVATDFGGFVDEGRGMVHRPDGTIVVAGYSNGRFALAAYDTRPHDDPITLRFYLHGRDLPGTGTGFTMSAAPAPAQTLTLNLLSAPHWLGDPPLRGTFGPGATFQLVRPCTLGLGVLVSYQLAKTDLNGAVVQVLGETSRPLSLCVGDEVVPIAVPTPVTFTNERLRLTIASTVDLNLNLPLGPGTFLDATAFVRIP